MSNPHKTTIRCRVTARSIVIVFVVAVAGAGAQTRTTYGVELRALDGAFAFAFAVKGQGAALALARRLGVDTPAEALADASRHLAGANAAVARTLAGRAR